MNYPFDNATPLHNTTNTNTTNTTNAPRCIIHPQQINANGHMLVQIHSQRPSGEPQTQSYYVVPSDLPDFIRQHQQQYPQMQFVQQKSNTSPPNSNMTNPTLPHQHQANSSTATTSTTCTPYDKFSSTYSSCEAAFGQQLAPTEATNNNNNNQNC